MCILCFVECLFVSFLFQSTVGEILGFNTMKCKINLTLHYVWEINSDLHFPGEKPEADRNPPVLYHNSRARSTGACNCGRKQAPRDDPFDIKAANYDFYQVHWIFSSVSFLLLLLLLTTTWVKMHIFRSKISRKVNVTAVWYVKKAKFFVCNYLLSR